MTATTPLPLWCRTCGHRYVEHEDGGICWGRFPQMWCPCTLFVLAAAPPPERRKVWPL